LKKLKQKIRNKKKEKEEKREFENAEGRGDFYSKIDLTVGNNGFGFELVKMCCNFCNVI